MDEEIRRVVMNGYERARGVIEEHREAVRLLAEELLQIESLEADEIRVSARKSWGAGRATSALAPSS